MGTKNPAFAQLTNFASGDISATAELSRPVDMIKMYQEQIAAAAEEGFQRGLAAGEERMAAEKADVIAQLTQQFELRLTGERFAWVDDVARRLADGVAAGLEKMSDEIEASVAALLEPWLTDELRKQANSEFNAAIDRVISKGVKIEVSGPQNLLDALAKHVEGRDVYLYLTPSETTSLQVRINDVLIELNFAAWLAQLKELAQ